MISINDVYCETLINDDSIFLEQTRFVKADWNGMDEEERSGYWTTEACNIQLNAYTVLEDLFDKIEEDYYYEVDIDDFSERLWDNLPDDFIKRFQELLDEFSELNESIVLKRGKQIDPTIDFIEVEK